MRPNTAKRVLINLGALFGSMALTAALGLSMSGQARAADAFTPNDQPIGHVAMPAVTSNLVAGGNQEMFVIDYNSQTWTGNLRSYPISATGQVTMMDMWDGGAASKVDAQDFDAGRKIFTAGGRTFRWDSLTVAEKAYFGDAMTGPKVVNFLRGDRSAEAPAGALRTRVGVLGDIIHSTPVYHRYGAAATVFVGANDGMLHAFDAATGAERFAYVPAALLSRLSVLSGPDYVNSHEYFVDGNLAVRAFPSQTVLVGALGAGGRALFALDVTAAAPASEAVAAQAALWEVTSTSAGFANLGYTYAAPVLGTLPSGTPAVVVGNGYNNAGNGQASLFVINALTGQLIAEISTGSGSAASPNGLSTARVLDTDADGKVDTAYAGDLDGNLWKFSLVNNTATLLLTTTPAQAITMAPVVRDHPMGGRMVAFVTGRMLAPSDAADASVHYAYGVWDGAPSTNLGMVSQTLTDTMFSDIPVRYATGEQPVWAADKDRGWKVALPAGGERVVGDGAVAQGSVFQFLSTNPTASPSASPSGENWWMQLNVMTGGDNGAAYFDLDGDGKYGPTDWVPNADGESVAPVGKQVGGGVRSQFVILTAEGYDVLHATYDINSGLPPEPAAPPAVEDPGVSGGHFDFDIYCYNNCNDGVGRSSGKYYTGTNSGTNSGLKWTHVHEYDDIYDVTGVDMLNASQALLNLRKALTRTTTTTTYSSASSVASGSYPKATTTTTTVTNPSATTKVTTTVKVVTVVVNKGTKKKPAYETTTTTTTTVKTEVTAIASQFKILVANQAYSPAAKITVGGAAYAPVRNLQTAAGLTVASIPTYSYDTVQSLAVNLPLDAFKAKDWGTGTVRAGLHPTRWDCVVRDAVTGPNGERRNGALLIQVIDASVTDADIQLNVANRPELGYRLKDSSLSGKLLAEYTMFWHHPNDKCMADSGWTRTPPEDPHSDATPATPAAGSTDPKDGLFNMVSQPTPPEGEVTDPAAGTGGSSGTGSTGGATSGTTGVGVGGDQKDAASSLAAPGTVSVVNGENKSKERLGRVSWRVLLN